MFNTIRSRLTFAFILLATIPLLVAAALISRQGYTSQTEQALLLQSEVARRVATEAGSFLDLAQSQMELELETHDLINEPDAEGVLSDLLAFNDAFRTLTLLDQSGEQLAQVSDMASGAEESMEPQAGSPEVTTPLATGQVYFGPVTFNAEIDEPIMTIALPVLQEGAVAGVLVANVSFAQIWELLASLPPMEAEEEVYIVDARNAVVAHQNPDVVLQRTQYDVPLQSGIYEGLSGATVVQASNNIRFGNQAFTVVAEQNLQDALAVFFQTLRITGAILLLALVLSAIVAYLVVNRVTAPLVELTNTAEAIQAGDLTEQADTKSYEEVAVLAGAFNAMTARLREMVQGLEARVSERTRALETSIEVSRRLGTILDPAALTRQVAEQIRDAFDYYHVQIYLYDEAKSNLLLAGGTGEAGRTLLARAHRLARGQGLVGRTAATNQVSFVPDVGHDPDWLPNPLLPETEAEIAVPIAYGEDVLGVLDVQHNVKQGLNETDIYLLQSLAGQVAIALQNARLLQQTQQRAQYAATLNAVAQKIQQAQTVESALQVAAQELGEALNVKRVGVQLNRAAAKPPANGGGVTRGVEE